MARFLIIEDSPEIAELLKDILEEQNHDIDIALDGEKGIKKLEQHPNYDIIISDVIMPERDGFDVLNFIKSNNISVPTLMISGGGIALSSKAALAAIQEDATAVLNKPISKNDLLDAVEKILSIKVSKP